MRMAMTLSMHVVTHELAHTAIIGTAVTVTMVFSVTMAVRLVLCRLGWPIVGMLCMRCRRVQRMRKFWPHIRFLWRVIRVTPTFTLEMKSGCRQHLLQRRLATFGAILQWFCAKFLQYIKGMAASITAVIKNRHFYIFQLVKHAAAAAYTLFEGVESYQLFMPATD